MPTDGWHTITPRLFVSDPEKLIAFLKQTFEAIEHPRFSDDAPVELRIGDSIVMIGGTTVRAATSSFFYVYVSDADATYAKAMTAGAKSIEAPALMHYGDRRATIEDPFGNVWQIATSREERKGSSRGSM
jgi:PhnB protein